jgi:hypothetical protein
MKINFQSLPVYWINLADRTDRAAAMTELFERISGFEVDEANAVRVHSSNVRGFANLPMTVKKI